MNIGIFGGLFDPPHIGHLIIAQSVLEEFRLQKIIFIPAGCPPHKTEYSPYHVRYEMTTLAIQGNKKFFINDIEKTIPGKTYTVAVMRKLKKKYTGKLYFIIGGDQWEEIETWKNTHALFTECNLIVVPRPHSLIKKSSRFFKKILIGHSPLVDISSTVIRKKIKQQCNVQYLIPPAVYQYIKRKKLYI
ncbi:MAG: nicotinate (nicotinamide) nucleotide adenylyltransferase [candidate division WOR-3 bacterium]|nr:MAG: nicotinate (nicotinamide) nucleotide adenylyltransferase [candidate division WOR-3 bacterium]